VNGADLSGTAHGEGALTTEELFDVVVVGGGISGSLLAGVLSRGGVKVLIAEKAPGFRDIVRGEGTYPWGVSEARRLGVEHLIDEAEGTELVGTCMYSPGGSNTSLWTDVLAEAPYEAGFSHPRLQEVAFSWAHGQGADAIRPIKVTGFSNGGAPTVTGVSDGHERSFRARLVVGADGKRSKARTWTGGESRSDPEHHRFGGVAVSGLRTDDRDTDNISALTEIGFGVNWFAQGPATNRLYLMMTQRELRENQIDRSFDALVSYAGRYMPEGAFREVRQEGPIGFFSNADTWATRIAGNGVVLIGDAAGSPDPTEGQGTALVYRDVRELSDLLLGDDDWTGATQEFARRRSAYFEVIREYDRWRTLLDFELGDRADRLREGSKAAEGSDASLGGFANMGTLGPDGLVIDDVARVACFGEAAPLLEPALRDIGASGSEP
jgi:2-polyprenyl-6-methoxyphenol hydroxylase-like FAD-dependent oxidoreductase